MGIRENVLTAEQFLYLFTAVGWEPPSREQVEMALRNSYATFAVFNGEELCGMARLLGDGAMSFYVKDFAILPNLQGKGIGRMLMKHIECFVRSGLKNDWAVSLELISAKGKEAFYEKLGFEARPCSWDGPGMFKMLR